MFEIFLEMKWLFVVGCILPAFSNAITCVHRKDIDKGIFNPILYEGFLKTPPFFLVFSYFQPKRFKIKL